MTATVHGPESPTGPSTDPHQSEQAAQSDHGRVARHPRIGPVGVILALAVLLGLVLTAFALPAVNSAPRNVPIGVAAPAPAAAQVGQALEASAPGAFEVTRYADEGALTAAIRDRDVYGGIVVGADGASVLTAPAGSPVVAQGLSGIATGLSTQLGRPVPVTEVVSLPASDPRGAALATALLPLLIGAIVPVLALSRVVRGAWARLAAVVTAAVVVGPVLAALMHWYGAFEGSWVRDAAAMSAVLVAMSTALLGLLAVGGLPGLGLGAATFMLLGNPLSGIATAPEFLPAFWSTLGSWLPPGAGGQLLRSSAYFEGAGAGPSLVVLGSWFALGVVLVVVGALRRPRSPAAPPA